jgi:hypothetical protein
MYIKYHINKITNLLNNVQQNNTYFHINGKRIICDTALKLTPVFQLRTVL